MTGFWDDPNLPDPIPNDHDWDPATGGSATCRRCGLEVTLGTAKAATMPCEIIADFYDRVES